MKKIKLLLFSAFCAIVQLSCSDESTSDLIADPITEEITYTNTVKSIIDNNCISCHGSTPTNGAPMSLTTYANVKDAVLNRNLLNRISREQGTSGMMPLGGTRLLQEKINQINTWATEGFRE